MTLLFYVIDQLFCRADNVFNLGKNTFPSEQVFGLKEDALLILKKLGN